MNKQTGLVAGATLSFIASLLTFLASFITSIIIARTLGPEFKGIYTLTLYASSLVIAFCNLGLNGAITYFTASQKYSSAQMFTLSVSGGLILSLIGGGIFYLIYDLFLINNILAGSDPRLIQWAMLGLPLSLVTSFLSNLLLGQQRMLAYNLVNVIRVISNLVFQLISSALSGGVSGAVIAWLAANGVSLLLALWYVRPTIDFRLHQPWKKLLPESLSYGGRSYLANVLQFFNLRLDSFLVNFYQGAAAVGQYTTSVSSAEFLWYVPNAVSVALYPKVSSVDKPTANRITPQACRQTLLIVILSAIAFGLLGGFLIVAFYGQAFQPAVMPFMLLLPGMVGVTVQKIISADLSGRGKPQYAAFTAGVTVCLTVILDVALIPIYSINGAAIASSIAYITGSVMAVIWYTRETGAQVGTLLIPRLEDFRYIFNRGIALAQQSLQYVANRRGNS